MSASTLSTPQQAGSGSYYASPSVEQQGQGLDLDALLSGLHAQYGPLPAPQQEDDDQDSMPGSMFAAVHASPNAGVWAVAQHADSSSDADDEDDVRSAFPTFTAYGALPHGVSQWDASSSDEEDFDGYGDADVAAVMAQPQPPTPGSDLEEGEVRTSSLGAQLDTQQLHQDADPVTQAYIESLLALAGPESDDEHDDKPSPQQVQVTGPTVDEVLGKYVLPAVPEEIPREATNAVDDAWVDALLADALLANPVAAPQPAPAAMPMPPTVYHRFAPITLSTATAGAQQMPDELPYDAAPPTPRVANARFGAGGQVVYGPEMPPPRALLNTSSRSLLGSSANSLSPIHTNNNYGYSPAHPAVTYSDAEPGSDNDEYYGRGAEVVDWQQHRVIQPAPGRAGKRQGGVRGGARVRKHSTLANGHGQSGAGLTPRAWQDAVMSSPVHVSTASKEELFPWDDPATAANNNNSIMQQPGMTRAPLDLPPPQMHHYPAAGAASEIGKVVAYDPQLAARMAKYGWI